jgi:hypothetical protein
VIYTANETVSQHILQIIPIIALQSEVSKSSDVRGDRFGRTSRAAVKVKPLHNRGWFRVVIVLEQLHKGVIRDVVGIELAVRDKATQQLIRRCTADSQQNSPFLGVVSDVVRDEVVLQSLDVGGPVVNLRVELLHRTVRSHRSFTSSPSVVTETRVTRDDKCIGLIHIQHAHIIYSTDRK